MNDDITAELIINGTENGMTDTYSVQTYYNNMSANDSLTDKTSNLIKAIITYGHYSHLYFNYNMDRLVTATEYTTLTPIPNDYKGGKIAKAPDGVTVNGCTLILNTDTDIRLYFDLEDGKDLSDYNFKVNGKKANVYESDNGNNNGKYYMSVEHIQSDKLDDLQTFEINDATTSYKKQTSPLSYAYKMQNESNVGNVSKALYQYYLASVAYMEN